MSGHIWIIIKIRIYSVRQQIVPRIITNNNIKTTVKIIFFVYPFQYTANSLIKNGQRHGWALFVWSQKF